MKTIDFSYFIERYISGEMDQNEKIWFEKELKGNPTLQRELALREKADKALFRHDLIDLRNKLASIEKERKEKLVASGARKSVALRFAAAIAAIMLLGGLYLISTGNQSIESLYKKNFETYQSSGISRTGKKINHEFETAYKLYDNGDYSTAASKLREYLNLNPESSEARLIYGVSEMKNNDFQAASSTFSTIIKNDNNAYIDRAEWYLSLCFLKMNQKQEALTQLETILNSKNIYSDKAKKLIKKLK